MEPITLRLPEDLADELGEEASELGYSSRSEYIRRILQKRDEVHPDAPPIETGQDSTEDDLKRRITRLEMAVFGEPVGDTPGSVSHGEEAVDELLEDVASSSGATSDDF